MSRCDRFETEAVLLLERGLSLDEHFSACPDCLAARASYDRLLKGLAAVGEGDQPPVNWQAWVWERIEQRRGRRRWWAWWGLVPAAMAAASLAAFLLVRTPEPAPVFLKAEVEAGPSVQRGEEAKPGDLLRLTASTGGARHAELRVYRNDAELILHCSTEPPCILHRGELRATLVLDGIGRYQPLLLFSKNPLPETSAGSLDADTDTALAAGAEIEMGQEIGVR